MHFEVCVSCSMKTCEIIEPSAFGFARIDTRSLGAKRPQLEKKCQATFNHIKLKQKAIKSDDLQPKRVEFLFNCYS